MNKKRTDWNRYDETVADACPRPAAAAAAAAAGAAALLLPPPQPLQPTQPNRPTHQLHPSAHQKTALARSTTHTPSTFDMESTRPDADAELNYALRLVSQACQVAAIAIKCATELIVLCRGRQTSSLVKLTIGRVSHTTASKLKPRRKTSCLLPTSASSTCSVF